MLGEWATCVRSRVRIIVTHSQSIPLRRDFFQLLAEKYSSSDHFFKGSRTAPVL